jgi:hypothetical protein
MMRVLPLLILLAACGPIPRDPDGTSEAIAARGYVRVGIATDTGTLAGEPGRIADLLRALRTSSRIERGATEPLLTRLEEGELDLVLTPLAADTPWATRVTLGPSLLADDVAGKTHELRPAMRMGENAFIGRVHTAALSVGGTP